MAGFVASENASQVAHHFCMGGHVALLVPRVLAKAAAHCMSGVEGAMNVCLCVRVDLGSCLAHKRKTTFGFVLCFRHLFTGTSVPSAKPSPQGARRSQAGHRPRIEDSLFRGFGHGSLTGRLIAGGILTPVS